MFFVTMNGDPALNNVIHLHIPINMLYRYYCMFTTCNVHVQVTFIRDLWIFTEPIVGMCHLSLLTTFNSFCCNFLWWMMMLHLIRLFTHIIIPINLLYCNIFNVHVQVTFIRDPLDLHWTDSWPVSSLLQFKIFG